MNALRIICFSTFSIVITLTIVMAMSLFDLVAVDSDMMQILGAIDVCAFALFLKTFIRIYKYTHRD